MSTEVSIPIPQSRQERIIGFLTREFSISEASVLLMAAFLFSALLGGVRQILFNAHFGAGSEAAAYYVAFRLPDTLFNLIAGGALSSAMIPVLIGTTHDEGEAAGMRLISQILTALMLVVTVVILLGIIFAPQFVRYVLAPGLDEPTAELAIWLTRIMLLQPLALATASVAIAALNSRRQFALTALAIVSQNVTVIIGILASRAFPEIGIYGPTAGIVAGALLKLGIVLPGIYWNGYRLRAIWAPHDKSLREVVRLLIPNSLSITVNSGGTILDTAFASRSPEAGALPAIFNGYLLVDLPVRLLGAAVGQSAFPQLSAHAADHEWGQLRSTLTRALRVALTLAFPAMLALIFLARPIVSLAFERGRFDASAAALTAAAMAIYAFGLPAYIGTELISRGLIALRDTRTPLLTNSLQLAGRALILTFTVPSLGVMAIPIALAITATLETLLLGGVLAYKLRRLEHED